jgi:soluble lytic murein transglycosylase-like protein
MAKAKEETKTSWDGAWLIVALGVLWALSTGALGLGGDSAIAPVGAEVPYATDFNATAELGIDPRLVAAVGWVESSFSDDVIFCRQPSPAGALGIMQFMPATAAGMGIDPCDPHQAIPAGARYLVDLHEQFDSWELAVAAYNAGPGSVAAAGPGIPHNGETENHVPKVMDQWRKYQQQFPAEPAPATAEAGR